LFVVLTNIFGHKDSGGYETT